MSASQVSSVAYVAAAVAAGPASEYVSINLTSNAGLADADITFGAWQGSANTRPTSQQTAGEEQLLALPACSATHPSASDGCSDPVSPRRRSDLTPACR